MQPTLECGSQRGDSGEPFKISELFLVCTVLVCMLLSLFLFPFIYLYMDHDTWRFSDYFFNVWKGLNHSGIIAWWDPAIQNGYPTYIYAAVGDPNANSVIFVLYSALFLLLRLIGITVEDFTPYYVVYYAVVIPAALALAVYFTARQVFKEPSARLYALIAAALSPGALFNLTDVGLMDPAIYLTFLIGAAWAFIATPTRTFFWMLAIAAAAFALSLGYTTLIAAALLLPLVLVVALVSSEARSRLSTALTVPTTLEWVGFVVLIACCLLPAMLAYAQTSQLVRDGHDGVSFANVLSGDFRPGNPLEIIYASIPHGNFNYVRSANVWDRDELWLPRTPMTAPVAYYYMGLLTIPLAIIGLIDGRRSIRVALLILVMVPPLIFQLNNGSPFTAALLSLPTPLQSMRHLGDAFYRGGGFVAVIFAAAAGIEALALDSGGARRRAPWLVAGMAVVAIAATVVTQGFSVLFSSMPVGFIVITAIGVIIVLNWLYNQMEARTALLALLLFALVDAATVAHWHVSKFLIGPFLKVEKREVTYSNYLIRVRSYNQFIAQKLDPDTLPQIALFDRIHPRTEASLRGDIQLMTAGDQTQRSLAVDPTAMAYLGSQLEPASTTPEGAVAVLLSKDFNQLWIKARVPQPMILFVRSTEFSGWKATVNGKPTQIVRALGAFTAIAIPAGLSDIYFNFYPSWFAAGLAVAYLAFALAIIALIWQGWGKFLRGRFARFRHSKETQAGEMNLKSNVLQ
jgi:Bacterial membrane protein YfhO